ncbi:CsgG/HfaB family protein [Thermodesulfatator atlanticus]|uniref:CsgG/HfaB family protein n=1 Tax=Thermodesulfatator atlanticus TaxID=501497 RepID=UPI0003B621B2|nr:curli assembly protein CsgG [Thermodesulfatator atlanticus]
MPKTGGVWSKVFLVLALCVLVSCTSTGVQTNVDTTGPSAQQVLTYKGPKARIAVASFKCKAAKCSGQIGAGIADMLATALFRTGRFIVLERGEGLEAIKKELALGQSGYVRPGAAPQPGQMEGADILVVGAITAFEPEASGFGAGGVVVPFKVPLLGGVKVKKKEAYIAADLRLIDVRTGRVINATSVEGKASSWNVGGLMGTVLGDVGLGGGLEVYRNTPMEKAVRVMLYNAVQAISQLVPENYYRWGQDTQGFNKPPVTPKPAAVSTTQPSGGVIPSGVIQGGAGTFMPGSKVLFAEDFSGYNIGDIPKSLLIRKGQVEVAAFSGKKWLRALSGNVEAIKKIDLPENFAVEWSVYFSGSHWDLGHAMFLGYPRKTDKPDVFSWTSNRENPTWSGQWITTIKLKPKIIHHFAVQQKDGMIRIFADGHLIYKEPVGGGIVGAKLPNRDAVSFVIWGENPSEGKECLITDIKITAY